MEGAGPVVRKGTIHLGGASRKTSVAERSSQQLLAESSFGMSGAPFGDCENAVLDLGEMGSGLAAVSQSPDAQFLCTGGGKMLSMVNIQEMTPKRGSFGDVHHIRRGGKTSNIQDVRWHPIKNDVIACSASNGQIVLWNVTRGRAGAHSLIWESKGHERTVWRLAWCQPGNEIFMLSGSLDGTIRMWDARASCKAVMEMSINRQQARFDSLPHPPALPFPFSFSLLLSSHFWKSSTSSLTLLGSSIQSHTSNVS